MEFFIKKKSSFPEISVDVVIDSRNGYNQSGINFTNASVTFSMYDKNSENKKEKKFFLNGRMIEKDVVDKDLKIFYIKDSPANIFYDESREKYVLSYNLNLKYTQRVTSYVGFFTLLLDNEKIILPIAEEFPENRQSEKLYINVIDSISDPSVCCRPNRTITSGFVTTEYIVTEFGGLVIQENNGLIVNEP
jgi:hypothetical protein